MPSDEDQGGNSSSRRATTARPAPLNPEKEPLPRSPHPFSPEGVDSKKAQPQEATQLNQKAL
eukprot:862255-Prorocentrum_lima.AAC.1